PDEEAGGSIRALVQLRKDVLSKESFSEEKIHQHCQVNLTKYKIPTEIFFMDSIHLTSVRKVLRRKIRNTNENTRDKIEASSNKRNVTFCEIACQGTGQWEQYQRSIFRKLNEKSIFRFGHYKCICIGGMWQPCRE